MRINFRGQLVDEPEIRAGFIGCGSHSFRNIYPTFQFAPVRLKAVCDLSRAKAEAFAAKFGADAAYADYREMLARQDLDAVFIVTGYDEKGRPLYPALAADCLAAGCHVWIEKPAAASCAEIERLQDAAAQSGKQVMVGMKKMFFPANQKAKELADAEDFGRVSLVRLEYPQYVPTTAEFAEYLRAGSRDSPVRGFLDHICHPVSLLLYLLGMPATLYYERSAAGAAAATFGYDSGVVAAIALTSGAARNCGMERTVITSDAGKHIVVDNNLRVSLHRNPGRGYGDVPDYFAGAAADASAVWEPEFSLGQLYNKGLFLLGYYNEVNEFARCILEKRLLVLGTLTQAWQATRIFEAFAQGPGKVIGL